MFVFPEFPDVAPITKGIRLSGNLAPFGSSQFAASVLCFLISKFNHHFQPLPTIRGLSLFSYDSNYVFAILDHLIPINRPR